MATKKKKKKKQESNDLDILSVLGKDDISEKDIKKAQSKIKKKFKRIVKSIIKEKKDINKKKSIRILEYLLAMTLDLIPVAEEKYKDTQSNGVAYVLINLTKQAQELMEVINELKGENISIDEISLNIVKPYMEAIFRYNANEISNLKSEIEARIKGDKEFLTPLFISYIRNFSKYLEDTNEGIVDKLKEYLEK